MLSYIFSHMMEFWYIFGAILMALEMLFKGTVVLIFAGISAFILAFLINFNLISESKVIHQIAFYFLFFFSFSVLMWRPVMFFIPNIKSRDGYHNAKGDRAKICGKELRKGDLGTVKWSGTICNARILSSENYDVINIDEVVVVDSIDENTFIVKKQSSK